MKKNKNKKLFIIIIVLIVLILIVGTVFAFVATDLFKSNKDMFFQYASQLLDNEKGMLDNKIEQYNQKKSNSKYEFLGNFTVDIDSDTLDKNTLNSIQNMDISFAGNIDNILEQQEALVKVNYTDDVNFPIMYKKSNGLVGIQLNDVIKKYLAVKQNEFSSLLNKFGINLPISLDSIDFSQFKLPNKDSINAKYIQVIKDNLEDSSFSKVKGMNSEGYCLEITNQKILELVEKVLESMKGDTQALNTIQSFLGTNGADGIDAIIQSLSGMQVSEGKSRITIYQKDGKLNKIEIQFNDLVNITISKNSTDNDVNYNIYAETQNYSISFDAKYTGLNTLQSVDENYSLKLVVGDSYTYNFEKTVSFTDDIEIKDFVENEYSDLNKMNKEQLNKLIDALAKSIDKVNNEKLEKAGLTGKNPLQRIIPDFSKLNSVNTTTKTNTSTIDLIDNELNENSTQNSTNSSENDKITETNKDESNTNNNSNISENNSNLNLDSNSNTTNGNGSNIVENMEKVEKETFNARFTQYEGQNVRGATVKSLIMQVIATNMADEEKKIKITGDITLTGDEVPANIETTKTYKVKCSTGLDGYIDSIEILANN